jgi:hypothetical protein
MPDVPLRPPPLAVADEGIRRDVDSDDVRRVHPDLPPSSADARFSHLCACDERAYATIRDRLPHFTPPSRGKRRRSGDEPPSST